MPPNPLADLAVFLSKPAWFTIAFWLLLAASAALAWRAWCSDPAQRNARMLGLWLLRLILGAMWWQQSLWKIPPNEAGLLYWMGQMAAHAAIPVQGWLVKTVVIPHIAIFGPLVYATEVAIGVSLMLGLCSRAGAALGAGMAINLWLGLYSAPGEWPWTYGFLVLLQLLFLIDPPGRALGADLWLRRGGGVLRCAT
ncbi:MAG: DoxX family membrane protein [Rhodospirillales bacterium]|nr:DoxX family membrane protein [Rhodospirillales bacterium]